METMQRFKACVVIVIAALTACKAEDKTFGASYDACILRNATKGGDDDSRNTAEAICARHFTRAPTDVEAALADGRAKIVAVKPVAESSATGNSTGPWNDYSGPTGDTIHAYVENRASDVIIKKIEIDANFYDGPPDARGNYTGRRSIGSLTWSLDANIEPGGSDDLSGTFNNNKAPSYFYLAHFKPTEVLPHTGDPQKSMLREVP